MTRSLVIIAEGPHFVAYYGNGVNIHGQSLQDELLHFHGQHQDALKTYLRRLGMGTNFGYVSEGKLSLIPLLRDIDHLHIVEIIDSCVASMYYLSEVTPCES